MLLPRRRPPAPRTAFITGASAGIGRALAERLAARGVAVALAARRAELLEEVRAAVEAGGGRALVVPVDVARPDDVLAAMERVDDQLGGIDLVIANAGVGGNGHAKELTWGQIAPMLQLNVQGALATLTALLPRMAARGRGHLVGVSSLAGIRGLPQTAAYSASKAALSTFLESLHVDLDGSGVFVTDARPGYVKTDLTADRSHPMPMLMELADAADLILAGVDAGAPVVAFPRPLSAALAASRALPRGAYVRLARRLIKR